MTPSTERGAVLRAERIRELYGRSGGPGAYGPPVITVLAATQAVAIVWPAVDHVRALAWVAVILAVELVMASLIHAFHAKPRADADLPVWARRRVMAEVAHGLACATMAPLVYSPASPITLVSVVAFQAGMVGAVAAGLGVHMPSMAAFIGCAIPVSVAFLMRMRTGADEVYASFIVLGAGLLALVNAARMSGLYQEAIRLRLDLAAELDTRRQLQEAAEEGQRLAEQAAAERIRFFGAASHDLRQPVHALGLYASLLRRDPPARERRELIDNIAACIDSLDRLFNAILGVARASRARQAERMVAFPLQEVIDRVLLQLAPEAERRGLALRSRPTRRWVQGDPGVVERILANLGVNALRYTEAGGVLVGVRGRGGKADLVVADTGVGLDAEHRDRIFDAFYQVGLPHRDRSQGFGLGLATVRELCLAHGYDIALRSRPGRGTVFRISLPEIAPTPQEVAPLAGPNPEVPDRLNVLLVEDDPLVADAVARLLATWDVAVHLCRDGDEALATVGRMRAGRWHAILDYRLPGSKTGLDVADRLLALPGRRVEVSLLTGEADPAVFAAAEARGVAVLQKPLKPIRLRALLAKAAVAEV